MHEWIDSKQKAYLVFVGIGSTSHCLSASIAIWPHSPISKPVLRIRIMPFDADSAEGPDPACHFDADPDSDHTFHFDADPDPIIQRKAQNLWNSV